MSLAGPYGEAACRYCHHLVDLGEDRKLIRHKRRANETGHCAGSGTYAHTQQEKEVESLAFKSDPVERFCPHCGRRVVINTVSRSRAGWRYSYHRMPGSKLEQMTGPHVVDCPQGGQLVGRLEPQQLTSVQVQGPEGQWVDLDGVTGIRIDPF